MYEIENRIIGFIGLNQEYIEGIFVDANYHNKGIGTELIQKAKSIRNRLILKVYQKNLNAIQFYKKNEFK